MIFYWYLTFAQAAGSSTEPLGIFLQSLGANGPWALVAGYLLQQILAERKEDRKEMLPAIRSIPPLLTEVRDCMRDVRDALRDLSTEKH